MTVHDHACLTTAELPSSASAPITGNGQYTPRLGRLADSLRAISQKALSACLANHGFAELVRVIDSPEGSQVEDLTKIRDSELGPTTMDDARSFGILGMRLRYTRVPSPEILFTPATFDSILNSCQTSAEYQSAMTLVGSLEKVLRGAGVRVGSTREPERATDNIDGITIARYRAKRSYVPSAEEVKFAAAWARCDSRVDYSLHARQRMANAMSEWEKANSDAVSSLEKEILTRLHRTTP